VKILKDYISFRMAAAKAVVIGNAAELG